MPSTPIAWRPPFLILAASLLASAPGLPSFASDAPPVLSFRNEVMAVLSKAGCNTGPCHGNQNGKAGFRLSLRGEDPAFDLQALTRDMFARRVDPIDPEQSLVLLKPTTQLAHEGGLRFRKDSDEYAILRRWIAAGMPDDDATAPAVLRLEVTPAEKILVEPESSVQLRVLAIFADDSQRDVTRLAVYDSANTLAKVTPEGLVQREGAGETTILVRYLDQQAPVRLAFVPARPGFVWRKVPAANAIDEQVFAKLRTLRMNPSETCTDGEFIRRTSLDLLGILPTADEARAFVADRGRDKRARLVNQWLERPEFADFWALKWSDVLRNEEKVNDRKGVQAFHHWIREGIAGNKPLDQFVREILSARGSTYANPPANFYRANRDAVTRSEAAAQLFLGTRLQCAKCHNHPYNRWTQADYYDWAAVFSRIDYKVLSNQRRDDLDKHEFIGEQIVCLAREGTVTNPRTGKAAQPRFLGERATSVDPRIARSKPETDSDRLAVFAGWLTAQPQFAKSQVNWIWFHLMGRGLVDPIDDFRPTNPPSHPALLDALARDFAKHRFDVRRLIRQILNSRTYQRSAEPNDTNQDDDVNFSHVLPRRLSAEQLLDAQHQVAGVPAKFSGFPVGLRASQMPLGSPVRKRDLKGSGAEMFLAMFGKPARLLACECERSGETTLGQTFQLISGPEISGMLASPDNRLARLLNSEMSDGQLVEEIYWTALSRPPSPGEAAAALKTLTQAQDKRAGLEDVTWALLNAKEFVLRK